MLIAYSQPAPITWTIAGTGASYLTDTSGLSDGKPARVTRIQWLSAGSPAITDYVTLRAAWDVATAIRVVALLGVDLPIGTKLELRGEYASAPGAWSTVGGNALTQTVVEFVDGTRGCWWVLDESNGPLVGIELRIYNNDAGVTWATAATKVDIGEIFAAPAITIEHEEGWQTSRIDTTLRNRTIGAQLDRVQRSSYRRLLAGFVPAALANVRGGGLANSMDLDKLEAALQGATACAAIPRYLDGASLDTDELHRTAIYGQAADFQSTLSRPGNYYSGGWVFEEIPAN